jgi:hypothetical protein
MAPRSGVDTAEYRKVSWTYRETYRDRTACSIASVPTELTCGIVP